MAAGSFDNENHQAGLRYATSAILHQEPQKWYGIYLGEERLRSFCRDGLHIGGELPKNRRYEKTDLNREIPLRGGAPEKVTNAIEPPFPLSSKKRKVSERIPSKASETSIALRYTDEAAGLRRLLLIIKGGHVEFLIRQRVAGWGKRRGNRLFLWRRKCRCHGRAPFSLKPIQNRKINR
ncbi:hypothetical protein H6P81_014071 [Aristolochia fimbriata]|uniref:Uncharacterized protein n=1 Tax=Aristolochia fimbriata TaxID=158543 RepID=A0AAV7EGP6_ARIFI|nr:hypothetical protein H6P81_014071 [Aristolochia fimbriata]